jgi:hypothetical protein
MAARPIYGYIYELILPGRDGYRCLEIVRSTGDCAENDRVLRRAEAFWIDRLRPVHNDVRPVRPPGERIPRSRRPPAGPAPNRIAGRRRRKLGKPLGMLALIAAFTYLSALALLMMQLPWPQVPWVGAPVLGVALGWSAFWRMHRALRKLVR